MTRPLIHFIKDLCNRFKAPVITNVLLQFMLGLSQGLGLLLLLPLLFLSGVLPSPTAAMVGPPWLAPLLAQLNIASLLLLFCALIMVHALIRRQQTLMSVALENNYANLVRARLYQGLCQAKWWFLNQQKSATLTHTLTNDIHRLANMVKLLFELVCAVLIALAYILVGLVLHPGLVVITLACGAVLFVLLRRFSDQAVAHGVSAQHHMQQMYGSVIEFFSGIKTIKAQAMEASMSQDFKQHSDQYALANQQFAQVNSTTAMYHDIGSVIFVAVILYAGIEVFQLPASILLLLLLIFARLMPRLALILRLFQQLLNHLPAYQAIVQLQQQCHANAEPDYRLNQQALKLNHHIILDNIYLYAERRQILTSINLTINAQSTIALVGPSGAGKSTLADIIAGLALPTQGQLRIDGQPLAASNRLTWRRTISYVTQDPFLFHDTLANNLRWLNPNASDAQLYQALDLAAASAFVKGLPQGLDTVVGDRGMKLSGGEKQRIALARALLNNPRVLILDEATSALDLENEQLIQQALQNLHGTMTIIFIAHRLSSVRHVDVIHVLERGALVESGHWSDLSSNKHSRLARMLALGVM